MGVINCNHHRAAGPSYQNICFAVLTGGIVPSKARSPTSSRARRAAASATNLANACGLLVDELDVITDKLVASGKIERNVSGDDETLFTSPHDDCFWGARRDSSSRRCR